MTSFQDWTQEKKYSKKAIELLNQLLPSRCQDVLEWQEVGRALYAVDPTGLYSIWVAWSKTHKCEHVPKALRYWQSFRMRTSMDALDKDERKKPINRYALTVTFMNSQDQAIHVSTSQLMEDGRPIHSSAEMHIGSLVYIPGKEVWQEIVMIDTVLYRVAVIPHDKSQKPAGGKLDGTDVKAYDQCACCLRKSVYVLEKLVPKPTCRSCSVLCQGGKCFAMRRNWIPISAFAGAWVKEQDYYFQLPKRNIAWGMVQLQTFAKKDVMIAGMDASALFEEHAKKLKITQCFADWQKNKADIEIAKKRLQNIPQECAGNEVLWKRIGKACYAVSYQLYSAFENYSVYKSTISGKQLAIGPKTAKQCKQLWKQFRPRTTADAETVVNAKKLMQTVRIQQKKCTNQEEEKLKAIYKRFENNLERGIELSFLETDQTIIHVPCTKTNMDHPDDVEATVRLNDLVLLGGEAQWQRVIKIDLKGPSMEVESNQCKQKTTIKLGKLSGAWVQHRDTTFQLPRESAKWGLDKLKEFATLHGSNPAEPNSCIETELIEQYLSHPPPMKLVSLDSNNFTVQWCSNRLSNLLQIEKAQKRDFYEWVLQVESGSNLKGGISHRTIYEGTENGCNLSSLSKNTTYRLRLYLQQVGCNTSQRKSYTVAAFTTLPEAPQKVQCTGHFSTPRDRMIEIAFGFPKTNLRFRVESRCLHEDQDNWKTEYLGRNTSHMISGLNRGKSYCFRVCAINADGHESDFSSVNVVKVPLKLVKTKKTITRK